MATGKVLAIIQARMGSTRLPQKVMMDLAGEPMLARVVSRTARSGSLTGIVVATTDDPGDDAIVGLCRRRGWDWFRGSRDDVLDRYYRAATQYSADTVVRVTSDCPLIEPEIVDRVVEKFSEPVPADYACNSRLHPRTFPVGQDVEVMSFHALERAWREDGNPAWREHVTPYIYYHPEKFRVRNLVNAEDLSSMRWTVDTPEDLAFVRRVYGHFGHDRFTWRDVLEVLTLHADWLEINHHVPQRTV